MRLPLGVHSGGKIDISADIAEAVIMSSIDLASTDMYLMLNRTLDVSAVHEIALGTTSLFVDAAEDLTASVGNILDVSAASSVSVVWR